MYGVAATPPVLETGQGLSLGRAGTPLRSCASPQLIKSLWQARGKPHRLIAALDPTFPNQQPELTDFQWPSSSRVGRPGETEREVKAGAKEKWHKHNESALSGDTPLPLPMAYPGTAPLTQREIDAMMNCDPELEVASLYLLLMAVSPRCLYTHFHVSSFPCNGLCKTFLPAIAGKHSRFSRV